MIRINSFLLYFLLTSYLFAQNTTSSPFSSTGLGERTSNGTQASRHMGGLDVFTDSIHANLNNPASYGFLKFTTYSVGINYTNNNLASVTESQNSDLASLDYLSVSIPTKKFGFGFGLKPFTSVGYRIQGINTNENVQTFNRYEGSGGLNQAYLSIGVPITKYFAIGSSINYNFGNLFYRSGQYIDGIDNGTFLVNESSISGFNYELSVQAKIPVNNKFNIQLMISTQPKIELDSQNSRIFYTQSLINQNIKEIAQIDLNLVGLYKTNLELSQTTKIGTGFGRDKKWFFGFQYNLIKSESFENVFFERRNVSYQDAQKWTFGGYYIPNYSSFTGFWKRVVYRVGFRTEKMSMIFNNIPLVETGITFGLGLPLAGMSNANVGVEISQRGQKGSNFIQERIIALRVGLSLNDLWFIKRMYN